MPRKSKKVDLSVVVTVHSETIVGGPTMRAADASIDAAIAAGFNVERIIALDNATPQTTAYFTQDAFSHWQQVALQEGDLGRARNAIIRGTTVGDAIAFLDADDLFSENWLAEGMKRLRKAEAEGQRVIVHPEVNWLFDGAASVYWNPEQDDPLFTQYYLYIMNYYDSLCLTPREVHMDIPYVHRDIPAGLSFQDWQFSIETMAAGWRHATAPDTIIFKRRRDNSLVTESQGRRAIVRALPPMRVDKIAALGAPVPGKPAWDTQSPSVVPEPDMPVLERGPAPKPSTRHRMMNQLGMKELPGHLMTVQAPEVSDPPPNYGQRFAARVAHAKGRAMYRESAKVYAAILPHFDVAYYLARYHDIMDADRMDPVGHWLRVGTREGRQPTAWFDPKLYRARYPDVRKSKINPFYHYLTIGKAEGRICAPFTRFEEIADVLDLPAAKAQDLWIARYHDLQARLAHGELGAQVTKAGVFEPLVEVTWPQAFQIKIPAFHSEGVVKRLAGLRVAHAQAEERTARAIILVNKPRWGGARRMEGHIADALVSKYGADQVVVISTEESGKMPEGKFPEGVRHIDLCQAVAGEVGTKLNDDFTQRLLVEIMRSLGAEVVFNVNSRTMWQAMTNYGDAMAASMKIIGCFLCNEQTRYGYWTGYPLRRFYRTFDQMWATCTDSQFLVDELSENFVLPPDQAKRVHVLRGPVDTSLSIIKHTRRTPRAQVFWAGRMDPQKRIDLAFAVAELLPDVNFRMWGDMVMGKGQNSTPKPKNVLLEGTYTSFTDLPLDKADMWLYTSAWDGIPQTLLEVGMTGIPLIGTAVGGTPEVLREGLGAAIPEDAGPEAYAAAISAVLADPAAARARAAALREMLLAEHTTAAYRKSIDAAIDGPD